MKMEKILFLNEKDRNVGLNLKHSGYRYETAKPVTVAKPKHDEAGFTIPYAMFRPNFERYREGNGGHACHSGLCLREIPHD